MRADAMGIREQVRKVGEKHRETGKVQGREKVWIDCNEGGPLCVWVGPIGCRVCAKRLSDIRCFLNGQ